jgi:hypothetical protein
MRRGDCSSPAKLDFKLFDFIQHFFCFVVFSFFRHQAYFKFFIIVCYFSLYALFSFYYIHTGPLKINVCISSLATPCLPPPPPFSLESEFSKHVGLNRAKKYDLCKDGSPISPLLPIPSLWGLRGGGDEEEVKGDRTHPTSTSHPTTLFSDLTYCYFCSLLDIP